MSGRRQHHVWQMVQRGFSWRERGDDHIWVYKKATAPRQSVTRKYGQEKKFYGDENSLADENITDFENQAQELIHFARKLEHGAVLDARQCASYVAHLEMRSKFLRSEVSNVGERLFREIRKLFDSRKNAEKLIVQFLNNRPELIEKELLKNGVPAESLPFVMHVISSDFSHFISSLSEDFSNNFQSLLDSFSESLAGVAKSAHNKSLESSFFNIGRFTVHSQLMYHTIKSEDVSFILPDTCLAVIKADGCAPLSSKDDDIEAVFCPISSSVGIMGVKSKTFFRDVETLNKILASCSYESFIANCDCPKLRKIANRIGRNAQLLSDAEIRKISSYESFASL